MDLGNFTSWGELAGQLVAGALIGFLSGYLLRKVSRILGVVVLLAAVVVYFFVWKGFLVIDWGELAEQTKEVARRAADSEQGRAIRDMPWKEILRNNLPFSFALGGGGIAGFIRGG